MTPSEAMQKIETWLLVPVNLDDVLPALAALQSTSEFSDYVSRVAEAEYKLPADIVKDVETYIAKHPTPRNADFKSLEQKKWDQNSIFPKPTPSQTLKSGITSDKTNLNAQNNVHARMHQKHTALVPTCQKCGKPMVQKEITVVQPIGWVLFAVLFFAALPLSFLPIIFCRDTQRKWYCTRCHHCQ